MFSKVSLYSSIPGEIYRFLSSFFSNPLKEDCGLVWEKEYQNPIEIADIIGSFIDNNDRYQINMWISLDKGFLINVRDSNVDDIIRYLYERFPY